MTATSSGGPGKLSRYERPLSPASVNRELATLRRLLRLAQEWKVLDRVPRIRLLRGEHQREFVLSHRLEPEYLDAAPQPLRDVALLILESGIRPGEAANLQVVRRVLAAGRAREARLYRNPQGEIRERETKSQPDGGSLANVEGPEGRGQVRMGVSR